MIKNYLLDHQHYLQAAYRGYYVRRNMLSHLTTKKQKKPKVELPGPPADVAGSREINLGPIIVSHFHRGEYDKALQIGLSKKNN